MLRLGYFEAFKGDYSLWLEPKAGVLVSDALEVSHVLKRFLDRNTDKESRG